MKKYVAIQGDTYDMIALRCTGDENNAPAIMLLNPTYTDTVLFSGAEILYIPDIKSKPSDTTPPWRRSP